MKMEYLYLGVLPTEIIKLLWKRNVMEREEIAIKLKRPRTTIYDNLKRMSEREIVESFVEPRTEYFDLTFIYKRGRPKVYWRLTETFITDMEDALDGKIKKDEVLK